jgi:tRNA(Ile)-lysidine synthase
MDERFSLIIKEKFDLSKKKPLVIGFSGGIDSVCLATLFRKISIPIIIAHFNHCLRETADRDESFSRDFARNAELDFDSEKFDVAKYASDNHLSLEEAARKKRYDFLFRIAKKYGATSIAVGHHADDQVETVVMHLFRGSGLAGLSGMKEISIIPEFDEQISIIRPLLSFSRGEIETYCKKFDLEYVEDETNLSQIYERNRIRHEILPFLNIHYPGLNKRFLNMTRILQDEDELLNDQFIKIWEKICNQSHPQFIRLNKPHFSEIHPALQRRIIRHAFFSIKADLRDLSFDNVNRVIQHIISNKSGEIDIQNNIIAMLGEKEIIIGFTSKEWIGILFPQIDHPIEVDISRNQSINLSEFWRIEIINQKSDTNQTYPNDEFTTYLNADLLQNSTVILRKRKTGDRFQPLGMEKGKIKISDFFINEKLLKAARKDWPLITDQQDEIIWIPGFRPSHSFRITESTKNIIQFKLIRQED